MEQIHRIEGGNVNVYVVANGKEAVLIDTGRKNYRKKVLEACKPYHINLIVLTHGHLDHIENAEFLVEELKVPIAIGEEDKTLLEDNMNQSLVAHTLLGKLILKISLATFDKELLPEIKPSVFLKEGDSLEPYGIKSSIVKLPGHTKGSIGIKVNDEGLIVGDALMNMFYPTVSMLYHDKNLMLKTAKKISEYGNCKIYFGHGKPVDNREWTKNPSN